MLPRLILFLALASVTVVTVPANADGLVDITDTVKEVFKVRPGGTLVIDIDHGNIIVETTRANEVRIELERSVSVGDASDAKRILERHEYSFNQSGNDVEVRSRFDADGSFWGRRGKERVRVKATVQIPERYNVDFTSGAGNVMLADIGGSVNGRTGAGNVKVGSVRGELNVSSGSGNIEVSGARGPVIVSTGAGNVSLENLHGSVEVKTGAGNIAAYITDQPRESSVLETGAGNVTVYVGDAIRANIDANAALGSASTDFPLKVEGKWMSKSFAGDINGGGPSIRMRAGVGNVSLKRLR